MQKKVVVCIGHRDSSMENPLRVPDAVWYLIPAWGEGLAAAIGGIPGNSLDRELADNFYMALAEAPEGPQDSGGRIVVKRTKSRNGELEYSHLVVDNVKEITVITGMTSG